MDPKDLRFLRADLLGVPSEQAAKAKLSLEALAKQIDSLSAIVYQDNYDNRNEFLDLRLKIEKASEQSGKTEKGLKKLYYMSLVLIGLVVASIGIGVSTWIVR